MKNRTWTREQLGTAITKSSSLRQVIKDLGLIPAGGNYTQVQKYIKEYGFDISHFKGQAWNKGLIGTGRPRITLDKILVENSDFQSFKLKKRLFLENIKPKHCEECGWEKTTQDGYLPLELHHINGIHSDNRLENLIVLCPNCHSLKPNHRGRNQTRSKLRK